MIIGKLTVEWDLHPSSTPDTVRSASVFQTQKGPKVYHKLDTECFSPKIRSVLPEIHLECSNPASKFFVPRVLLCVSAMVRAASKCSPLRALTRCGSCPRVHSQELLYIRNTAGTWAAERRKLTHDSSGNNPRNLSNSPTFPFCPKRTMFCKYSRRRCFETLTLPLL